MYKIWTRQDIRKCVCVYPDKRAVKILKYRFLQRSERRSGRPDVLRDTGRSARAGGYRLFLSYFLRRRRRRHRVIVYTQPSSSSCITRIYTHIYIYISCSSTPFSPSLMGRDDMVGIDAVIHTPARDPGAPQNRHEPIHTHRDIHKCGGGKKKQQQLSSCARYYYMRTCTSRAAAAHIYLMYVMLQQAEYVQQYYMYLGRRRLYPIIRQV